MFITLSCCLLLTTDNEFFLRFHKIRGGGGEGVDGRISLEFLEPVTPRSGTEKKEIVLVRY